MQQSKQRGMRFEIHRTSFPDVKIRGTHHLWFDGSNVLEFHLQQNKGLLRLRKTLNTDLTIKHSSGDIHLEKHTLKKILLYGALATGTVVVLREPAPIFLASGLMVGASFLLSKPTVRLIFDFGNEYIIASVASETAAELVRGEYRETSVSAKNPTQ